MTPKEKIIAYMKAKRLALFKLTGINLYIRADYAEIRKLSDEECERIWEKLSLKHELSELLCPQCIFNSYCNVCGYGKRHGKCVYENDDNTWGKINNIHDFDTAYVCHPIIDKLNKEN